MEEREITRAAIIGGRYIKKIPKGWKEFLNALSIGPLAVKEINCKGKFIYWRLEDDWSIWNSLGMTGSWSRKRGKFAAVRFQHREVNSKSDVTRNVFFEDMRRMGTLRFVKGEELLQKRLDKLGFDMLQEEPSDEEFKALVMKKPEQQITKVLMDQNRFAGVGNYIKADALYLSRISPRRIAKSLSDQELEKLKSSILEVMSTSYNSGGSTIKDYRDMTGEKGMYRRHCYGRKTDAAGNKIIKEKTEDNRTTHWCPNMQN